MADQNSTTHTPSPFLGDSTESTLTNTSTVVGMLKEFMSHKQQITYDEQFAITLILQGVEAALTQQRNTNAGGGAA